MLLKIIFFVNNGYIFKVLIFKDLEHSNLSENSDNPHENYTNLSQTSQLKTSVQQILHLLSTEDAPFNSCTFYQQRI